MTANEKVMARYLRSGKYKYTDLGLERECSKCREYWPADSEFWQAKQEMGDGLSSQCKACLLEYQRGRRRAA